MPNITKVTENYIQERPSIKDCLKKDLINYSKLSRKILEEQKMGKENFDAILIATRRASHKIKKEKQLEKEIIAVLSQSKVEMHTKVCVVVLEGDIYHDNLLELQKIIKKKGENFHVVHGSTAITMVTSEEFMADIQKLFKTKILRATKGLVLLTIKSSEAVEETPGVIAYLTSLFAERGINIVEAMSCWTDTLFVVMEKDAAKALELISF